MWRRAQDFGKLCQEELMSGTSAKQVLAGRVSRRTALKTAAGAIAVPAVLRVIPVNAQSRVIKMVAA